MIQGFSHLAIVVPDLEKAREFYEKMFGFKFWKEETWDAPHEEADLAVGLKNSAARGYIMIGVNCYLEFWQFSSPVPKGDPKERGANDYGIRHICFQVDDVMKEFERLEALGGIVMGRPSRKGDEQMAIYCRDPFGNIIELMESGALFPPLIDLDGISAEGTFEG